MYARAFPSTYRAHYLHFGTCTRMNLSYIYIYIYAFANQLARIRMCSRVRLHVDSDFVQSPQYELTATSVGVHKRSRSRIHSTTHSYTLISCERHSRVRYKYVPPCKFPYTQVYIHILTFTCCTRLLLFQYN